MEENEITEKETAEAEPENEITEESTSAAESAAEEPSFAENAEPEGEKGEENSEMNAESFAKTLANPMFAVFARGRSGDIEQAVRDFEKMLAAGREGVSEEMLMKMTPGAIDCAGGGAALSERQRKIARQAGMSYREYYEIIRSIPTKTK